MKRIMIVTILIFFQSCLHRDIKNNITELLNKKIIIPENLEAIPGGGTFKILLKYMLL